MVLICVKLIDPKTYMIQYRDKIKSCFGKTEVMRHQETKID